MQVPMLSPELEERFSSQIMCTYVYLVVSVVFNYWTFHQIRHVWEQNSCCFCAWIVSGSTWFNSITLSHLFRKWKFAAWIRVICYLRRPIRKILSCRPHVFLQNFQLTVLQIDLSKELIAWVKSEGFSLLDANLFPKPTDVPLSVSRVSVSQAFENHGFSCQRGKSMEDVGRDVLIYLWDNYVQ